jgi:hypothetical protein
MSRATRAASAPLRELESRASRIGRVEDGHPAPDDARETLAR